ncbi:MAG: hypothetical protein IJH71_00490 [Eubacterium sp.]|nr:hypothetical protein [Eubacterium sp.]
MIRKKLAVLVAAVITATSVLAGCGGAANKAPAETASTQAVDVSEGDAKVLNAGNMPTGGLFVMEDKDTEEYSEADAARADKAMRAYEPALGEEQLLINNSQHFYYYEQMDADAQGMYDAMHQVAQDPQDTNNIAVFYTELDPNGEEFIRMYFRSYYGLMYDHPELFWLYNGCEASIDVSYIKETDTSYKIYFHMNEPFAEFETQMTAFNNAVNEFLSDIDMNGSDYEKALAIHDKLIDLVIYDYDVLENENSPESRMSLAHTAYGALVDNGKGQEHYAVCDGYSAAYTYLLGQAGVDSSVILGLGGSSESESGGHAWNVVKMDGDWYEVDSTWDDMGNLEHAIPPGSDGYPYYEEAKANTEYYNKIQHYMFGLTTQEIRHFVPDSSYAYTSSDGKCQLTPVGECVHIRANEVPDLQVQANVVELAPEATGTRYGQ